MHKHLALKASPTSYKKNWPLFIQRRFISTELLSSLANGAKMYGLQNNLRLQDYAYILEEKDRKEQYVNDSFKTLQSLLKPNCYYIVVDKAVKLAQNDTYPGHISSFITDSKSVIEINSCVSLRAGKRIPDLRLEYTRSELGDNRVRFCGVSKVEFVHSAEDELKKFFFRRAIEDKPLGKRLLIELPFNLLNIPTDVFISRIISMKDVFSSELFLLFDGVINSKFSKARNCVAGFYKSHSLVGTVINPSPQMAAWSYLNRVLKKVRDEFIQNTDLKQVSIERIDDDKLEYLEEHDLSFNQPSVSKRN